MSRPKPAFGAPALAVAALALSCLGDGRPPAAPPLTTLAELGALASGSAGERRPVDVRGVVTYFDAERGVLYLQDVTGAAAVEVGDVGAPVTAGESVRLEGTRDPGALALRLGQPSLTVVGRSSQELMPEPRRVRADELLARRAEAEWVEARGVVRAETRRGRSLVLDLQDGGRRFRADVVSPDQTDEYPSLVDSRVRLRGVATARAHAGRARELADVLVPDIGHLRLEADAPADPFALPLASPERLARAEPLRLPEHRVRVRGLVSRRPGERTLVLSLDGREYPVAAGEPIGVSPGERVDVVGFAVRAGDRLSFEQAIVRAVDGRRATPPSPASLPLLTTAAQVRGLSRDEARRGYPIRLRAVVTFNDPDMRLLFVQDGTAGIYAEAWRHIHRLRPGDRVQVEGLSAPGAYAPVVDHPRVRVLGSGPLPPARRVRPEQLVSGQEDSQWVEVDGVVRAVTPRRDAAVVRMAAGGARFTVVVSPAAGLEGLVNARVRVRAACQTLLTPKGQLAAVVLHSPGRRALRVLTPPTREPFSLPVEPIGSLLQFVPGRSWEHRVRVKGVAAHGRPGELYVLDPTGGLLVRSDLPQPPQVGDEVDAIGFAAPGPFGPVLQDAEVRSLGRGTEPRARPITPEQAMSGGFDGELVQLEARLLDSAPGPEAAQLSLQAGPYLFTAAGPRTGRWPRGLRPGSELRVSGICAVDAGELHVPQGFRILLRSPADVVVLRAAPWWTPRRAAWLLAGMAGMFGLALAWVATLRRRVRAQSLIIWRRVKHATELQERQRMARELHDTLEQNLTGISLSLEAASLTLSGAPRMAEQHLGRALVQVEASMGEVHRAVWALRDESLDARGLPASLDEIARQLRSCSPAPMEVHTSTEGVPRPFALTVENSLLRIGQEALTNAVKHAGAAHVRAELRYLPGAVLLRVSDDGRGFDAAAPGRPGHFGLIGMRERSEEIGARLEVRSALGRGTDVEVTLPLRPLAAQRTG